MSGYPIMQRLNPPMEVKTPLGDAIAHFLWAESPDSLYWGVCQIETGESWWFQNSKVRYDTNITMGRVKTSPIAPMPGLEEHLKRYGEPKDGVAR